MPVSHILYGLRIASDLPIPGLAVCKEQGPAEILILLQERQKFVSKFSAYLDHIFFTSPHSDENGGSILQVGTLDNGRFVGFHYSDGARFAVEREGREIWADWPEHYTLEDACTYLIGPVMAFALRLRGFTCLHASSIAVSGRAIAVLGQPGAGKSTTAAAFACLGYPILSDDVVVLDDRGDRFFVPPGYPRVNLWPDSVRALFGSNDALPNITPTWGKRYLALNQNGHRFQEEPLPLGAVYMLAEHEPSLAAPVMEEFGASEAFMTLVANTYVNYLLDADMRSREFDVLGRLVAGVPIRRVRAAADSSRLFDLVEAIVADASRIGVRTP